VPARAGRLDNGGASGTIAPVSDGHDRSGSDRRDTGREYGSEKRVVGTGVFREREDAAARRGRGQWGLQRRGKRDGKKGKGRIWEPNVPLLHGGGGPAPVTAPRRGQRRLGLALGDGPSGPRLPRLPPDLPGSGGSAGPPAERYSPAFFGRFVGAFLDALGVDRAAVVGNSLGGLAALRFALSEPERVAALGLVASAGLGRRVNPALRSLALPGYGGLAVAWGKRRPGAAQRVLGRSAIIFSRPWRAPREWLKEQYRLTRLPGVLEAQLATARSQVGLKGQREVLLDRLPELEAPTLVVWGERDRVLPPSQAREAMARLRNGTFELVPDCGHLPQVERPERFASGLARFLDEKAR
jgi:pimeloyl-ACP methyl ester carboxylesterase